MDTIFITGGRRLEGEVCASGSKNSVLAIMAGAALVNGTVTLHNVPRLSDTQVMVDLMNHLGAPTRFEDDHTVTINSSRLNNLEAPYHLVQKMRASFNVMGPMLARFGFARVSMPGGCDIGARPVNFHIEGLRKLGAQLAVEHGVYEATTTGLKGAYFYLDFQSAGATQHLMTAAALAEGDTTIDNCAAEPEVVDLANFLNKMGARVEGAGTSTIVVHGVKSLHGGEYDVIPDRLDGGTYAVAAAITGGDVLVRNAIIDHMRPALVKLQEMGVQVREDTAGVRITGSGDYSSVDLKTAPHPGFPTDMQQVFAALLSVANGTSVITENVYESRFRYVNELNRMGADIRVQGKTAVVTGVSTMTSAPVTATDLRAGASLVCAGLRAHGETRIVGVEHIDRGYDGLVPKLKALGAKIARRDHVPGAEEKLQCSA